MVPGPPEAPTAAVLIVSLHLWLKLAQVALCFLQTQESEPMHRLLGHTHNCKATLTMQEGSGVMRGSAGGEIEEGKKLPRKGKGSGA